MSSEQHQFYVSVTLAVRYVLRGELRPRHSELLNTYEFLTYTSHLITRKMQVEKSQIFLFVSNSLQKFIYITYLTIFYIT